MAAKEGEVAHLKKLYSDSNMGSRDGALVRTLASTPMLSKFDSRS